MKEASKRFDLFYEYCGYKNHVKDDFCRLVGHPFDFQSKKPGVGGTSVRPSENNQANNSNTYVNPSYQSGGFKSQGQFQNHSRGYRPQGHSYNHLGGYRPQQNSYNPRTIVKSSYRPRANTTSAEKEASTSMSHSFLSSSMIK